jgi:hypothetical protein
MACQVHFSFKIKVKLTLAIGARYVQMEAAAARVRLISQYRKLRFIGR